MRGALIGLAASAVLLSGCGSGASQSETSSTQTALARPVAERVCAAARRALSAAGAQPVSLRVISRDAADVRCRLTAGQLRLVLEAKVEPQAWMEFDTTQVHQVQGLDEGAVHHHGQYPVSVATPPGTQANWIPAQREMFATNGSDTRSGGSYVTVFASHVRSADRARALARRVTLAALATAPRSVS